MCEYVCVCLIWKTLSFVLFQLWIVSFQTLQAFTSNNNFRGQLWLYWWQFNLHWKKQTTKLTPTHSLSVSLLLAVNKLLQLQLLWLLLLQKLASQPTLPFKSYLHQLQLQMLQFIKSQINEFNWTEDIAKKIYVHRGNRAGGVNLSVSVHEQKKSLNRQYLNYVVHYARESNHFKSLCDSLRYKSTSS